MKRGGKKKKKKTKHFTKNIYIFIVLVADPFPPFMEKKNPFHTHTKIHTHTHNSVVAAGEEQRGEWWWC